MNRAEFIRLLLQQNVLQFGSFQLKSGRQSPYFFNLGNIDRAGALQKLGRAYADRLAELGWQYDLLFGPAYKGIPIATATAVALADADGSDPGVTYNRKEAKSHGEGGVLVGADVRGARVVVLDDVFTAGTAVRSSRELVTAAGGQVIGVLVALDRQERTPAGPAAARLAAELSAPVESIVRLEDVIHYLDSNGADSEALHSIRAYFDAHCR